MWCTPPNAIINTLSIQQPCYIPSPSSLNHLLDPPCNLSIPISHLHCDTPREISKREQKIAFNDSCVYTYTYCLCNIWCYLPAIDECEYQICSGCCRFTIFLKSRFFPTNFVGLWFCRLDITDFHARNFLLDPLKLVLSRVDCGCIPISVVECREMGLCLCYYTIMHLKFSFIAKVLNFGEKNRKDIV